MSIDIEKNIHEVIRHMDAIYSNGLLPDPPDTIRSFVMIVGWARSGNSVLGQIINAHHQALIANEGRLFEYCTLDRSYYGIYHYLKRLDDGTNKRNQYKIYS